MRPQKELIKAMSKVIKDQTEVLNRLKKLLTAIKKGVKQ